MARAPEPLAKVMKACRDWSRIDRFGNSRRLRYNPARDLAVPPFEVPGMSIRRNPESGRRAVLWLATAYVSLFGAAACAVIVLAAVRPPIEPLLVGGAIIGGFVVLLAVAMFRRDSQGSGRWMLYWLTRHRANPRSVLRIGRKRSETTPRYGTNSPPTLDSVREAAEENVSWVPHGAPQDRPRPR